MKSGDSATTPMPRRWWVGVNVWSVCWLRLRWCKQMRFLLESLHTRTTQCGLTSRRPWLSPLAGLQTTRVRSSCRGRWLSALWSASTRYSSSCSAAPLRLGASHSSGMYLISTTGVWPSTSSTSTSHSTCNGSFSMPPKGRSCTYRIRSYSTTVPSPTIYRSISDFKIRVKTHSFWIISGMISMPLPFSSFATLSLGSRIGRLLQTHKQ